jgi:hypothetical protein
MKIRPCSLCVLVLTFAACGSDDPPTTQATPPDTAGGASGQAGAGNHAGTGATGGTGGGAGHAVAGSGSGSGGGDAGKAGGAGSGASGLGGQAGSEAAGGGGAASVFFTHHLGTDKTEVCSAVAVDAQGTITFGGFSEGLFDDDAMPVPAGGAFFLRKLDSFGGTVWTRAAAGAAVPSMLAPAPDGGTYALLVHANGFDLGLGPLPAAGSRGVSLVRFDGVGDALWQLPLPKLGLFSELIAADGAAFVVGAGDNQVAHVMRVEGDKTVTFDREIGATLLRSVATDAQGDLAVVGATSSTGIDDGTAGSTVHGLIARLDAKTAATHGSVLSAEGVQWTTVASGPQGLWVGGRYTATAAADLGVPVPAAESGWGGVLARLDETDAVAQAWGFTFTQPATEANAPFALLSNLAVRADGKAFATMLFRGTGDVFGQVRTSTFTENWGSYVLLEVSADGATTSARELSVGAEDDVLHAQMGMTVDADGVLVAGSFGDAMGADLGGAATFGGQDIVVARLPP